MNPLNKTLSEMPEIFTSNHFAQKARLNGVDQKAIDNNIIACFLHENAVQTASKRTWRKSVLKTTYCEAVQTRSENLEAEQNAVSLLKSLGYKIMKPKTDWIEC